MTKISFVFLLSLLFIGCTKNGSLTILKSRTCIFIFEVTSFSGPCISVPGVGTGGNLGNGKIDVTLSSPTGSNAIFIYNMPDAASGSFKFNDGFFNAGGSVLYALYFSPGGNLVGTKSGTLTKTGKNSFTFTCIFYDPSTEKTYTGSGYGTYE